MFPTCSNYFKTIQLSTFPPWNHLHTWNFPRHSETTKVPRVAVPRSRVTWRYTGCIASLHLDSTAVNGGNPPRVQPPRDGFTGGRMTTSPEELQNMAKYGQNMAKYWQNMAKYGKIWQNMAKYGKIWQTWFCKILSQDPKFHAKPEWVPLGLERIRTLAGAPSPLGKSSRKRPFSGGQNVESVTDTNWMLNLAVEQ